MAVRKLLTEAVGHCVYIDTDERRCQYPGCKTKLSQYNIKNKFCFLHTRLIKTGELKTPKHVKGDKNGRYN